MVYYIFFNFSIVGGQKNLYDRLPSSHPVLNRIVCNLNNIYSAVSFVSFEEFRSSAGLECADYGRHTRARILFFRLRFIP